MYPIGLATSGQTSCRGLRELVAADGFLDVSRGRCGVGTLQPVLMAYEYGIGISPDERLKAIDDAMAEEIGDGRFKNLVVHLYFSSRLGNILHVALLYLTCADCQPMQAIINGGNRASYRALSLAS